MLGRHNCRHGLLLWNRGHSPLKVIVRRLKVILVSGTNNELVAAQLKHPAGDYHFPWDKCVGISRPKVEADEA